MEEKLVVVEILKMVRSIDQKLDATTNTLQAHMVKEEKDWEGFHASIAQIQEGFPNKDMHGHAAYHTDIISIMAERKAFWKKMRETISIWGLVGVIGWLSVVVWNAFLQGPHK